MSNIEERVIKMVAEQLGVKEADVKTCPLYTSDAADDLTRVDLGSRRHMHTYHDERRDESH